MDKCEFCGRAGEKETAQDIKKKGHFSYPDKLCWLCPDEVLICNRCLKDKSRKVPVGGGVHT